MERIVLTMPIAPYSNFSVGRMSTPILAESLAKKIGGSFQLAVNLLDSYNERNILGYKKLLEKYKIIPDNYWVDNEHISELIDAIYFLMRKEYIYESEKEILTCDCKKVEISKDYINSINMIDSCFEKIEDKFYCKSCHTLCNLKKENVLVFDPQKVEKQEMRFFPSFINKDVKTFHNTVGKNQIVVSRERNTGINIIYNNKVYNIDVDFLWEVYLSLFPMSDKIVLCCNHQLFQLYMVLMLERCFNNETKTIGIATPYINIPNNDIEKELENRVLSLKLFTLFNLKWGKKENNVDVGLIRYLNSMNVEKKQQLYDIIMEKNMMNADEVIIKTLLNDFNFQNANNELRRRRKNV